MWTRNHTDPRATHRFNEHDSNTAYRIRPDPGKGTVQ